MDAAAGKDNTSALSWRETAIFEVSSAVTTGTKVHKRPVHRAFRRRRFRVFLLWVWGCDLVLHKQRVNGLIPRAPSLASARLEEVQEIPGDKTRILFGQRHGYVRP